MPMLLACALSSLYLYFPRVTDQQERFEELLLPLVQNTVQFDATPPDALSPGYGDAEPLGIDFAAGASVYQDAQGRISLLRDGEEQMQLSALNAGRETVAVNDDAVVRRLYDDNLRLVEKTTWANSPFAAGITLVSRTRYAYRDQSQLQVDPDDLLYDEETGSFVPQKAPAALKQSDAEDFAQKTRTVIQYDERANPVRTEDWRDGSLVLQTVRGFDDKGRLVSEEQTAYGQRVTVRLWQYAHTEGSTVPDARYFEDGILRLQEEHTSDLSYVQRVFFDGGITVTAVYQDGVRVSESMEVQGEAL